MVGREIDSQRYSVEGKREVLLFERACFFFFFLTIAKITFFCTEEKTWGWSVG